METVISDFVYTLIESQKYFVRILAKIFSLVKEIGESEIALNVELIICVNA